VQLSLALVTKDLPRLRRFYSELLRVPAFGDESYAEFRPGADWVLAITTQAALELHAPGAHSSAANRSVRIELGVVDPDGEYERLKDLVKEIVAPPTDWPWGTRSAWLRDPDGNLVSLFSVPARTETTMDGLTVEVADLERSRAFYEGLLGFEPGEFYAPTRWQPYWFGRQFFGIREILGAAGREREDILNFGTGDIESLWQRVNARADVVNPLERTPWGSYKFVLADPDGFHIGFVANP
jgi:catechol 2,3-dioxygenase-like lactoylglutathione lyase family enzyme